MNSVTIVYLFIGISAIACAPLVDIPGDTRPILDLINPQDELPIVEKERTTNIEVEGIPSKGLSLYDQSQQKYADIFQSNAKLIVDTIEEHEKYGNDGDRPFNRALVNTLEKISNVVNKLIETPENIARSISSSITEKLNQFGAKLVGL